MGGCHSNTIDDLNRNKGQKIKDVSMIKDLIVEIDIRKFDNFEQNQIKEAALAFKHRCEEFTGNECDEDGIWIQLKKQMPCLNCNEPKTKGFYCEKYDYFICSICAPICKEKNILCPDNSKVCELKIKNKFNRTTTYICSICLQNTSSPLHCDCYNNIEPVKLICEFCSGDRKYSKLKCFMNHQLRVQLAPLDKLDENYICDVCNLTIDTIYGYCKICDVQICQDCSGIDVTSNLCPTHEKPLKENIAIRKNIKCYCCLFNVDENTIISNYKEENHNDDVTSKQILASTENTTARQTTNSNVLTSPNNNVAVKREFRIKIMQEQEEIETKYFKCDSCNYCICILCKEEENNIKTICSEDTNSSEFIITEFVLDKMCITNNDFSAVSLLEKLSRRSYFPTFAILKSIFQGEVPKYLKFKNKDQLEKVDLKIGQMFPSFKSKLLSENGSNALDLFIYSTLLINNKTENETNPITILQAASDLGLKYAQHAMAIKYQQGSIADNIPKNTGKAISLYFNAARQGLCSSIYNLSQIYERQLTDTKINLKRSTDLLFKGAYYDDANCLLLMGKKYKEASGITRNLSKSKLLLEKASELGNIAGMTMLI